ncbi:hypothetical protein H6G17_12495 [Chroococcidiopsis sp. FACHB-1243]|uniref:hypothetical protein n=1 Tax=Chroococcidiopsis sp. [FACHB-1243] TaxID=2692781 RepID=UPI00177FE273|nr:hypothetical protein [Chroococcidiopsis sp. [FACHB-1243]]MBD2306331.1 hypothetical protein [Chroococcidiopsis sp. [FACHB-1243]]
MRFAQLRTVISEEREQGAGSREQGGQGEDTCVRGCPPLRSDCGAGVPPVKARRVKVSVDKGAGGQRRIRQLPITTIKNCVY